MASTPNDNVRVLAPKDIDDKKGRFVSGAWRPYLSVAEANQYNVSAYRYRFQEVLVKATADAIPTVYWYQDGTADSNLVVKPGGEDGVPTTRKITINGTTYDLSADRSWTVSGDGTAVQPPRLEVFTAEPFIPSRKVFGDALIIRGSLPQEPVAHYTISAVTGGWSQYDLADPLASGEKVMVYYTPASNEIYAGGEPTPTDTTAPTFSGVSVSGIGQNSATFNVQSNEDATAYWAAYAAATAQKTKAEIQAGTGAVAFGSTGLLANEPGSSLMSSLVANTSYRVHYFGRDTAGNETSAAITNSFTTLSAANPAPTAPQGVTVSNIQDTTATVTWTASTDS